MAKETEEQNNKITEEQKKREKKFSLPFVGVKSELKEIKKEKKKSSDGKVNPIRKSFNYFVESKEELKKVTWPTQKEAINYTIVVLVISAIAAIFLGTADYFLSKGLTELLK